MQRPANPLFIGAMAEWSCSGLQIRLRRFDSGSRLQISVTDSSVEGLAPGKPTIVAAGMQGERASVVFAARAEINSFIKQSGLWTLALGRDYSRIGLGQHLS